MAIITRYVNTASSAGGDGTTNAITGANRAYVSLSEWEAAEQTDLVTDTDSHVVNCSGTTADTTAADILGWTTGVTNDITVNGDNNTGIYNTSAYRLEQIATGNRPLIVTEEYVTVNDMQCHIDPSSSYREAFKIASVSATGAIYVNRPILKATFNNGDQHTRGLAVYSPTPTIITNPIVYGFSKGSTVSYGIHINNDNSDVELYNATCTGNRYSIANTGLGTLIATNCASWSNSDDFLNSGGGTLTIDYCASDDGDGTNAITPAVWDDVFVDITNKDFHLKYNDTDLNSAGLDLSGTFSDDIDGELRVNWDVGADEITRITHTLLTEGSDIVDGTSFTTASITPSAGKLLLVDVLGECVTANGNVQPTLSGCGVTWIVVRSLIGSADGADGAEDFGRQTLFRAMGTPTTGVLTIDFGSDTQTGVAWSVCEKGNVDQSGTNGSGAVVQHAANDANAAALTVTLATFSNAANATHGAYHATIEAAGLTVTPGSGFTEETEITIDLSGGWYGTLQTQYRNDNDTTVDVTLSATVESVTGIAIEIKADVDVFRYVNTNSTTGGDGTTNATTGANRAYVSRSEWDAAEATDLAATNKVHHLICDGTGGDDTVGLTTSTNWVTGEDSYVSVTNVNGYKLRAVRNFGKLYHMNINYYREDGFIGEHLSTSGNTSNNDSVLNVEADGGASSDIRFTNVHVLGGAREGILHGGGVGTYQNVLIEDCDGNYGFYSTWNVSDSTGTTLKQFTVVNSGTIEAVGANSAVYLTAKNGYAHDNGATNGSYGSAAQTNYVTCAASDTTGSSGALDSIAFSTSGGTNITADANYLSTDLDGESWANPPSVGAYEVPATTAIIDFEGGSIPSIIRVSNDNPWVISTTSPYAGTYCMESDTGGLANQESQATMIVDTTSVGTISFRYRTDSEATFDQLFFYIDGVVQTGFPASGVAGSWTLFTSSSLSVGLHIFQWIYATDGGTSSGQDTVYIDDIIYPAATDFSGTLESFESGIPAGWSNGSTPWAAITTKSLFGTDCIASNAATPDSGTSDISYTVTCDAGEMFFAYFISSEATFDFLKFYIDTVEQDSWSGYYEGQQVAETAGWIINKYTVAAGSRTFKWEYTKDSSTPVGDDRGYIDALYIPESVSTTGTLDTTDVDDTTSSSGEQIFTGTLNETNTDDTMSAAGELPLTALDFGLNNNSRYFDVDVTGGLVLPDADWTVGMWVRMPNGLSTNMDFQYIFSGGTLAATNSFHIFFGESSNFRDVMVRLRGNTGTEINVVIASNIGDANGIDDGDHLLVVQRIGTTVYGYWIAEGDTVTAADMSTSNLSNTANTLPSLNIGRRPDGNATRYFGNTVGEVFILTNDSLSNTDLTTLASGKHITIVRSDAELDLRFRGDNATEIDLSDNGFDATRNGTGYTLLAEFFPDGGIVGTSNTTDVDDTTSSSGEQIFTGTLNETDVDDTLAAVGTQVSGSSGTLNTTDGNDTITANGTYTENNANTFTVFDTENGLSPSGDFVVSDVDFNSGVNVVDGDDTVAADGTSLIIITGTSDTTDSDDTISGSGEQIFVGTSDTTDSDDTISANGSAIEGITGTVNETDNNDTSSSAGTQTYLGTLNETDIDDTSASVGTQTYLGTLNETDIDDTSSSSGEEIFAGTLNEADNNDSISSNGTSILDATGTFDVTIEDDSISASGVHSENNSLNTIDVNDTSSSAGTQTYLGTLNETDNNDTSASAGTQTYSGSVNETDTDDTIISNGSSLLNAIGNLNISELDDILSGVGETAQNNRLDVNEDNDVINANGSPVYIATLNLVNEDDTTVINAKEIFIGSSNNISQDDSITAGGDQLTEGTLNLVNEDDTTVINAKEIFIGSSNNISQDDSITAGGTLSINVTGSLNITENDDTPTITAFIAGSYGSLLYNEANDVVVIKGFNLDTVEYIPFPDSREKIIKVWGSIYIDKIFVYKKEITIFEDDIATKKALKYWNDK